MSLPTFLPSNITVIAVPLLTLVIGFLFGRLLLRSLIRKQEENRLSDLQNQFITLGSHYLLTPVATIQAATARLQEAEIMGLEERRKMYEAILQGESRLWIIAQQLILMNQMGAGTLHLDLKAVSLTELVLSSIQAIEPLARKNEVKVSFTDTTLGNSQLRADPRQLKQAIIAIIDNATKFSPKGSEVKIALGDNNSIYQLVIADAGTGMPPEVLAHITEKFYRGNGIYRFDYEGLGLGLYIAEQIIALHDGSMRFESAEKRGTRVTVEFIKH